MTLWCGLLSCLFVVPVPANSGPKFKVDANRLVADALIAETRPIRERLFEIVSSSPEWTRNCALPINARPACR
jgi:hypothetical protein